MWLKDEILAIDSETGEVSAVIDCRNLGLDRPKDPDAVLNGIAYDSKEKVFYLTGKRWPNLYKVKFVNPK